MSNVLTDKPTEWRDVVGYEGLYEVSSAGAIRSLTRTVRSGNQHGPMLKTYQGRDKAIYTDPDGYQGIALCKDGIQKTCRVSRLVLSAFVGAPGVGEEACHVDHDQANNALDNLHWGTRQANEDEKTASGRRPASTVNKLTMDDAVAIREKWTLGASYKQLAAEFKTHHTNVWLIVKGKTWQPA